MTTLEQGEARAAFWQQHIEQWRLSNQTQKAYCQEHDLDYHRFGYWLRRTVPRPTNQQVANKASVFVPVINRQASSAGLSLILPNGVVLQGIDSDNLSVVRQLLGTLS